MKQIEVIFYLKAYNSNYYGGIYYNYCKKKLIKYFKEITGTPNVKT